MGAFNIGAQVMGGGFSAGQVSALQGSRATAVTAAGTVIGTATALGAAINLVTTATADQGVALPNLGLGDSVLIYNSATGATIKVYPDSSSNTINQLTAGSAMSLANNTAVTLTKVTSSRWVAILSA